MPRQTLDAGGYDQRALQFVLQTVCVVIIRGGAYPPSKLNAPKFVELL